MVMKNLLIKAILFLQLTAFAYPPKKKISVWLIGDSTISVKETKAFPETGWGMPFAYFFDSTVVVENRAKNGRSTKSFKAEGLWKPVTEQLKEGDYVFIQFGHNDEAKEKVERYTTPEEFKANLIAYVVETKGRKAIPVLVTPVSRRRFDSTGKAQETHLVYSAIVREVAKKQSVAFIDLDTKSRELYQQLGPETSKLLFNYLLPNEHPNYPEGKQDNTHFNELGARKIASIVLASIRELDLKLENRIVVPAVK
jgi:lysophospholipase L1-like esterase